MSRRSWSALLAAAIVLGLGLVSPSAAAAGHPFALLSKHHSRKLPGNPQGFSVGPPGPHRYPEYNTGGYPWYGYGFGVPTYSWGYFGVRYRPACLCHKGYYGDYCQWGYRRGY